MMKKRYILNLLAIALIIVFSVLLFWHLGDNYLTNWDEAWYGDIVRNMVNSGDFVKLQWNGAPFYDKPPLYFWLSTPFYYFLSNHELAIRIVSSLSAVATIIVVYIFAKFLYGEVVGLWSIVILSSSIGFLYRVKTGNLDGLLTFFITFSITSFYFGYKKNKKWFLVVGILTGCVFLTKGFIAFFFPLILTTYFLLKKEYELLKSKELLIAFFLAIVIAFGWVLASFLLNGKNFLFTFLFNQGGKLSTSFSFWNNWSLDYFFYLKSGLKWWLVFFVPSIIIFWNDRKKSIEILLLLFLLLLVIILSFAENKSNWFLLPLYPIIAIIIAFSIKKIGDYLSISLYLPTVTILFTFLFFFHLIKFKSDYIVPDIAVDEVRIAIAAKQNTSSNQILYLTNYYYPTTVYYSQRKVYAVYSDQSKNNAWWIKPKTQWNTILRNSPIFIITTEDELKELQGNFPSFQFKILYKSGEKILIKKV